MKKYIVILILCLIALWNASYLSYEAFHINQAIYYGQSTEDISSFCDFSESASCTNVLKHPLSKVFWIPFPVIALFVYPILFLLTLYGYLSQKILPIKFLAGMSLWGMIFNGYIIFMETFYIHAFCLLCLMCSAIIVTIFILSILILKENCKKKLA